MPQRPVALYSLLVHAIVALAGAAFDVAAIAKFATIQHDWRLAATSTSIAVALFAAGCGLQAGLTYRHTTSWQAACRAFLHVELAYQAVKKLWEHYSNVRRQRRTASKGPAFQQQHSNKGYLGKCPSVTAPSENVAGPTPVPESEHSIALEDSALELCQPPGNTDTKPWVSPFAAAAAVHQSAAACESSYNDLTAVIEGDQQQIAQPQGQASQTSSAQYCGLSGQLSSGLQLIPSTEQVGQYRIVSTSSLTQKRSNSWAVAGTEPQSRVIRMLKLVHFGLNLPQACLALIVYMQIWQAGKEPVNDVLVVTIVLGIVSCAIIATEYFRYAEWSLWRWEGQSPLPGISLASKKVLTPARLAVVVKFMLWYLLYFSAAAVSIAARTILYMMISVIVKLIDPHTYLNVLMAFGFMLVWWCILTLIYYSASKQLGRSIKCGYLTMAMSVPFNPAAGAEDSGPCMLAGCSSSPKVWWLSAGITIVSASITAVLGFLQATLCLLSRHDSIKYKEEGRCNIDEYQMGLALAILAAADGVLYGVACVLSARRQR